MTEEKKITAAEKKGVVQKVNAAEEMPPEPEWLFYILSFFVQIAGIVIGAIYMGKPNEECRRFGKNCLIAAIIPILLYCLYILFVVACFVFYIVLMVGIIAFAGLSGGEYAFIGALVGIA